MATISLIHRLKLAFKSKVYRNHLPAKCRVYQQTTVFAVSDRFATELSILDVHCDVADDKAYRAVQIVYVNCKLKAEFL